MSSFCTGEDSDAKAEEHSEDESFFGLDDDCQTPCTGRDYVLSPTARLSGAQEERVTRLLQDVQAETPVFVAIMKMSTQNRTIVSFDLPFFLQACSLEMLNL